MKSVSVLNVLVEMIAHFCLITKAADFSAPFLVSIQEREGGEIDHMCSGTIISPARVLTADACVEEGIEELYVVAGVLNKNYVGTASKVMSYIVPEVETEGNRFEQMAVLTINPPFHLDGLKIAKINVDSEKLDSYSELATAYPFRVFLYFHSTTAVVRRLDMIPIVNEDNIEIRNKQIYLEYFYRYGDTGCNAETGSSLGSPIIRDNELVGVVVVKEDEESCDIETNAVAIRSSIFAYWINDQVRQDEFSKRRKNVTDVVPQVSAPFLVSIQRFTPTGTLKHFCTGSLIAADLILTAAICFKDGSEDLVIVVGISSLTDPVGQRRRILSYEISKSPDPLRQQIAVARIYLPFLTDKNLNFIDLNLDFVCGEIVVDQYIYSSETILKHQFLLNENANFSQSYFEIDPQVTVSAVDCATKLGSSTGAPVVFENEVVGVIIFELANDYCHIQSPKLAARVEKWKEWIPQQMIPKIADYDVVD